MFLVKSGELASVFSSRNKPVFNVEDVEKYGFGAIPECSGRIGVMLKCVQNILLKVRTLENSHRNICEKSRDMHVSTIFRAMSVNGNPEVLTCSSSLISSSSHSVNAATSVKSLVPSRAVHDGMGGVQGSGWYSAASSFSMDALLMLVASFAHTIACF